MQEVGGSIPPGSTNLTLGTSSPSSRGPGHRPFTAVTGVRIPLGTPTNEKGGSFEPPFSFSSSYRVELDQAPASQHAESEQRTTQEGQRAGFRDRPVIAAHHQ